MYIAKIRNNGEILTMSLPQGLNNLTEGYYVDEDIHVVYVEFDIPNRTDFMNTHYYNFETSTFAEREARPNPVAKWENNKWSWSHEDFLDLVREERNLLLYKTDWTQVSDAPVDGIMQEEALEYRQKLRNITLQCDGLSRLEDVPWPPKPDFL